MRQDMKAAVTTKPGDPEVIELLEKSIPSKESKARVSQRHLGGRGTLATEPKSRRRASAPRYLGTFRDECKTKGKD